MRLFLGMIRSIKKNRSRNVTKIDPLFKPLMPTDQNLVHASEGHVVRVWIPLAETLDIEVLIGIKRSF